MRPLVLLLFATALYAGTIDYETARRERQLQAIRTTEQVVVDGRLDEPAWSQAPVAADFIQNEPKEDQPASEKTEVRVLYDKDNLYVGVHAYDSEPQRVIISDLRKDFTRDSGDTVEIVLDTFRDERNGYLFATNAAGAKWDAQMTNEGRGINQNWDGVWYVKTRMVEDGWIAEFAIPFKTLKFRETEAQTWGINFQRNLRRKNEDSFWSPVPRIYNLNRVSLAGTLEGMEGIKPGSNIKVKPYMVTSFAQEASGARPCKPYFGANDGKRLCNSDFGLDVKYGLTSGLTWDFTYNTEFSQVEADDQQINLTRFSLLFPEKREFFLENSGIFQFSAGSDRGLTPIMPSNDMLFFFSRSIGLSEDGRPIPILGGTRLTGRVGGYELGLLNIQQREQGAFHATNFTVGRLRKNILGNSDIGVMLVNKEVLDSSHFNRVIGADANFRFGRALSLYSYVAKAFTPSGGGRNLAGRVSLHYINNTWDFRSSYTSIQENYKNEMGYVPRLGMRKSAVFLGRHFRPQILRRTIRSLYPHVTPSYIWNADGNLESRPTDYHLQVYFQNGGDFEPGLNTSLERLSKPFVINRRKNVVIPPGVYRFYEYLLKGQTNKSRRIYGNFNWTHGSFYTGHRNAYTLGGTFRFNHRFSTSFSYTHNNINLPQGHFQTTLLSTRVDYAFSTNMFLNALIQYNSDTQQWSSNVRFNFIHRPLSDFFLVYNERHDTLSWDMIDRAIIAKFTYMIAR